MRTRPGYTTMELDDAQDAFSLRFPPDLVDLLLEHRIEQGWDWVTDHHGIRKMLAWPLEGILFDVEHAGLWWPEWGNRPSLPADRADIVTQVVSKAPKLIPLYSHRFLPAEPCKPGNPVLSVYQSDIIYYGSDLNNWLERKGGLSYLKVALGPVREIRFWSKIVERSWNSEFERPLSNNDD